MEISARAVGRGAHGARGRGISIAAACGSPTENIKQQKARTAGWSSSMSKIVTPYRVALARLAPDFSVRTWEIHREKSHKKSRESDSSPYRVNARVERPPCGRLVGEEGAAVHGCAPGGGGGFGFGDMSKKGGG
eukprot:SAG31_NODE_1017_length_10360_cov_35.198811_13_plen_133_part_01